jgi:polar amino acid transport system substrate-binding protein/glutamate/aspartate transport system substrate-binding protein
MWVVGAFVAIASTSVSSAGGTLERIRDRQAIVLAYRAGAQPFSFKDREGRVRGYSVELCVRVTALIARQLGLPDLRIEWVPVDADARIDIVASGRADAECGTTTITLSRMQRVDFSLPIFVDGGTVIVRAQAPIYRIPDLKGRRIAVIGATTTGHALLRTLDLLEAQGTQVPVARHEEGVAAVVEGRVDAFAGDRTVLTKIVLEAQDDSMRVLPDDFSFEPYAIVVGRNDADFRLAVNRALVETYRRGDIDAIFQRWLAPLGKPSSLLNAMFYLNALPD